MKEGSELVLVTKNEPSIHYSTGDYLHIQKGGNEAWKDEVMRNADFLDRWMAESDASVVQLIPYVVCMQPDGKILTYQREGGNEGRLEGKCSIGIGGHVNDVDLVLDDQAKNISWDTVLEGAIRECTEELHLEREAVDGKLTELGTMYIPSSDGGDKVTPGPTVGEVHLGIVYHLPVSEDVTTNTAEGLHRPRWMTRPRNLLRFERWSQFILKEIDTIRSQILK